MGGIKRMFFLIAEGNYPKAEITHFFSCSTGMSKKKRYHV